MDAVEGRHTVLCNVGEVDERELSDRLSLSPLLPCTSPFLLCLLFPSKLNTQPFALTTPASPSRSPLRVLFALTPLPLDSSLGSAKVLHVCLSLSLCSSVPTFIFHSLSFSFSLSFLSPSQFSSVSLRSTKRQVASRCRWVNTGGVWAIFGRGGRKEWSYSESGSTSAPPFPIHPLTSSATRPASSLPCSLVRPRRHHSAKFLKRDKPQYNATLGTWVRYLILRPIAILDISLSLAECSPDILFLSHLSLIRISE